MTGDRVEPDGVQPAPKADASPPPPAPSEVPPSAAMLSPDPMMMDSLTASAGPPPVDLVRIEEVVESDPE